tara:strand:+ start:1791 stop:1904 length:114 start_codon:yes stop_codon:yes gene_type:complete
MRALLHVGLRVIQMIGTNGTQPLSNSPAAAISSKRGT